MIENILSNPELEKQVIEALQEVINNPVRFAYAYDNKSDALHDVTVSFITAAAKVLAVGCN